MTADKAALKPMLDARGLIGLLFLGIGVVELGRRHFLFAAYWTVAASNMIVPFAFQLAGRHWPRKAALALLAFTLALLVTGLILRWKP